VKDGNSIWLRKIPSKLRAQVDAARELGWVVCRTGSDHIGLQDSTGMVRWSCSFTVHKRPHATVKAEATLRRVLRAEVEREQGAQ
jgi:hypothetical protein